VPVRGSTSGNSVLRRALLWRSGLALGVFVIGIGFGASTSPQPPWPILLAAVGGFLAFSVITSLFGDRQLAVRAGRGDAPWKGSAAGWTQYVCDSSIGAGPHVATQAIVNIGGRKVELVNGTAAVGWIGSSWVNLPEWQEYQLAVVVAQDSNGGTSFTCCARPRWKTRWGGASKSRRLALALRQEVVTMVSQP
jgi:hypothetical protein